VLLLTKTIKGLLARVTAQIPAGPAGVEFRVWF
jgi:hypothetical protein